MAIDLRQNVKLSQSLMITPQLQQAIKLLQLSRMELEQYISEQLNENPVLEEGVRESDEEVIQAEKERETTGEEVFEGHLQSELDMAASSTNNSENSEKIQEPQQSDDWQDVARMQDMSSSPSTKSRGKNDSESMNFENMMTRADTLIEYLKNQLHEIDFDEQELAIAEQIIGNINEKGYFDYTLEDIASHFQIEIDEVEDVFDTIQRLDPPGVCARDLKECLLNQLRNLGLKNGVVEVIIQDHMKLLEVQDYHAISKALNISIEKVIDNIDIISVLEPNPGRQFDNNEAQVIIPDVYVFKSGNEWTISLNEEGLPKLQISQDYDHLLKTTQKKKNTDGKNFLQVQHKSASWLIKSIQQRQRTIYKVSQSIVEKQQDFLEKGINSLKPMILRDVADSIGVHESTVSRVTTNKYMHTPRGIFELKYFFSSSLLRADGESIASESVKKMIKDIVSSEDPKKPYSDQKIVDLLSESGVRLARRTVAKYREQLQILPSSKRKKMFSQK